MKATTEQRRLKPRLFGVIVVLFAHAFLAKAGCVITDESSPFFVTSIQRATNGVALSFQSCPDHLYEIYSTDLLTSQSVYALRAQMIGLDVTTPYVDTNTASV